MLEYCILLALPWIAFTYENIALQKNAWQLHHYPNLEYKAFSDVSNAVDGLKTNRSFFGHQCTISGNKKYKAVLRIDLGTVLGIHHITIYYRTDNMPWGPTNHYAGRFLGFSVYISNTTDKEDGVLCFKDNKFTKYTIPSVLTLNCTHHGRYVIYYNNRTSTSKPADYSEYAYNELCEFEVYGCPVPDHYGKYCNWTCSSRCKDYRCHIETGYCVDCKAGYQGPNCEEQCENNTYGAGCLAMCGHCLGGEICNYVNGICNTGCEAGYYNFTCKAECPDGQFGRNCLQTCSEKCHVSKTCDKKNGACHGGCIEGWKLPQCNKECDDGTFGKNCSKVCGHCYQRKPCDKKTGVCPPVCDSGYEGLYCNQSKEINSDDSYPDPGSSSPPSIDEAEFSPLTGKLFLKRLHSGFETYGQHSVKYNLGTPQTVYQPTTGTTEQPRQSVTQSTSPRSTTFPEEHSFEGKHDIDDLQSEVLEKLLLEMEYIKLRMEKVSSEIEILELKKRSLTANCPPLSKSEQL